MWVGSKELLERGDTWVAFREVEKCRKGTQGPAACARSVCPLRGTLGLGVKERWGVYEGPSAPLPLPLAHLIWGKPLGGGALHGWRAGGKLQRLLSGGFGPENIWAPAVRARPPSGLQLAGGQVGWYPESHNGLEEFHSFPGGQRASWRRVVFADLPGDMGGPLSQDQGSPSLKTAWCPPHPARNAGAFPAYQGLPWRKQCPVPPPSPVSPK